MITVTLPIEEYNKLREQNNAKLVYEKIQLIMGRNFPPEELVRSIKATSFESFQRMAL